jgi:hypothetical protein
MTTTQRQRALRAMYVGLVATIVATIVPYVDHATSNLLADHIRDGYPAYTQAQIDSAATTWLVVLSVLGALGVLSWLWTIWAVKTSKKWSRWAASGMFTLGTSVATTALLVKDTSGDAGLAPLLGWIGLAPCLAGLAAVTILLRRS